MKVLLKSNANIQELTSDGLTALDLACASFASSQADSHDAKQEGKSFLASSEQLESRSMANI